MDPLPLELLAETTEPKEIERSLKSENPDDRKDLCPAENPSNQPIEISERSNEILFELDDEGNPYLRRPEVALSPRFKDPKVSAKYQWRAGSVITEDSESSESDEDFDVEFNKILSNRINQTILEETEEVAPSQKVTKEYDKLDKSYYALPDLSTLSLTCLDSLRIEVFGTVSQHLDALVLIKPKEEMYFLDVDSMLFDENKQPVGRIYELIGLVESPFYNILFPSAQEAERTLPLGTKVYFAPEAPNDVTSILIPNELETKWRQRPRTAEESGSESQEEDPEQAAYFARIKKELAEYEGRKRQKRGRQDSAVSNQSFAPIQRKQQRTGLQNPHPSYAVPGMTQTFVSRSRQTNPFAFSPDLFSQQFSSLPGQLYNLPITPNVSTPFFLPNPPM